MKMLSSLKPKYQGQASASRLFRRQTTATHSNSPPTDSNSLKFTTHSLKFTICSKSVPSKSQPSKPPSMAASLSFIVGIIGNVISILVFLSPIGTFRRVVKKKSTENYKGLPYIATLLSTSLWSFYGLLKPDGFLVVTVNAAGVVLQFIYVALFLIYAPKKTKVQHVKLVAALDIGFLGGVIVVALLAIHGSLRLTFVGVVCSAFSLGMYAAPLSAMRMVIKSKSVEFMPFFLSFFLFLNGGVWSLYSVLVKDYYIAVPNVIGLGLGTAQLVVYTIYKNKSILKEEQEEGSAHLVKAADIEMQGLDDDEGEDEDEDGGMKKNGNRSLNKGWSLPKPPLSRHFSVHKIIKALSWGPYELRSASALESDDDNGITAKHHR